MTLKYNQIGRVYHMAIAAIPQTALHSRICVWCWFLWHPKQHQQSGGLLISTHPGSVHLKWTCHLDGSNNIKQLGKWKYFTNLNSSAIWGWCSLLTMIPVRSQWGRYNLPRYIWTIKIENQTPSIIPVEFWCLTRMILLAHPNIQHPILWYQLCENFPPKTFGSFWGMFGIKRSSPRWRKSPLLGVSTACVVLRKTYQNPWVWWVQSPHLGWNIPKKTTKKASKTQSLMIFDDLLSGNLT